MQTVEGEWQTVTVPMETPTTVDAESFLSLRVRAGSVKAGETFELLFV